MACGIVESPNKVMLYFAFGLKTMAISFLDRGIMFSLEGLLVFTPGNAHFRPERSEGRKWALQGVNINNHDKLNVIRIIMQN